MTTETADAAPATDAPAPAGTTTIRIATATKQRLLEHADPDESIGDVVRRLTTDNPINTEVTRGRSRVAAYLRSALVRDFGDRDEVEPGEELWRELAALQHRQDPETVEATAVVLDHTALAALASGRRLPAQLLYTQPHRHRRRVYAPTQAIYTATVQHIGLQHHVKNLNGVIDIVDFDLAATLVVGDQVAANVTPAVAHVVHAAQPSIAWPTGRPVLTMVPEMYRPYRLQIRALAEV